MILYSLVTSNPSSVVSYAWCIMIFVIRSNVYFIGSTLYTVDYYFDNNIIDADWSEILITDEFADSCCKIHDECCGQDKKNQKSCNKKIVNCLKDCNPLSLTCTLDFIPVPAGTIEIAMDIIEDWCCGTPC